MRVLIADDEERYRDYLRASLAEHGPGPHAFGFRTAQPPAAD